MNTKALRQKILDLAIHGKLVPQDPNDEPASVLLERIKAEKERLIREGKIKRPKRSKAACDKPHYPYELPEGWCWCRLEDIAYVASGSTPDKSSFVSNGIPYIKMYNLRNHNIDFNFKPQFIKEDVHNGKLQRSRTEVGDLIMNIVGPPLGKLALIPPSLPQANFNQAAVLIRPYLHKDIINVYLKAYLEEMTEINSISTKGSAGQVNISLTQSQNMRIPLPPVSEQNRILKNLKHWLSMVDCIDGNKENLHDTIKHAKSKLLDLAIHGKLVPQDPTDEPASELLKRINPKAEIACDNAHYRNLPKGWAEIKVGNVAEYTNGRAFKPEEWESVGLPIIRIQNLNDADAHYNRSSIIHEHKYLVKDGDLLFAWAASLGTYIWNGGDAWLNQHIFKVEPFSFIDKTYLFYVFQSMISEFYRNSHGSGMVHITKKQFEEITLLLPPLSEQYRIAEFLERTLNVLDSINCNL